MASISSSINNTYMLYKMAQNNGMSLFGSTSSKSSQTNSIWDSYYGSASSAASTMSGLASINSSRAELVSSYDSAVKVFNADMGSAMKDLRSSISAMKGLDYKAVGENPISTVTSTAEDGTETTTTKYSKEMQEVLDTVKGFVDDYNTAVDFFGDYSDVSKKLSRMSSVFSDATARADTYATIGLNVAKDGTIEVDEEKLANAIVNSPGKVEGILGQDGLTGKAEDHVQFAEGQQSKLFPSINSMFGDQLSQASIYTGKSMVQMSNFATVGNLVNMMF